MIGVEEEFFIVDEETLFPTSFTPKIILRLIRRDFGYFQKSSMESPLSRELLKAGFPIIELKTAPHKDVDCLLDELRHHRGVLADVAREEHVLIVPSGLHPVHDTQRDSRLLCCALHVHVSGYPLKKSFYALVRRIPELISLSANSPFLNGRVFGKATRVLCSYAIGLPRGFYRRMSDVIINRKLATVELRVCDTQIVTGQVLDFLHLILSIVDSNSKMQRTENRVDRDRLEKKRHEAAVNGRAALRADLNNLYEEIFPSLNNFGMAEAVHRYLVNEGSPADFQVSVASKYGIAGVVESLWASFRDDELTVSSVNKDVRRNYVMRCKDLPYFFAYLPLHAYKLYRKFRQDDMVKTVFLAG